jgi:hypothetical protein
MLSGPGAVGRKEWRACLNSAKVNNLLYGRVFSSGEEKQGVCVEECL